MKKALSAIKADIPVRYHGQEVLLRPLQATRDDWFFTWSLRTSARGMAASRCKDSFSYERHLEWVAEFERNPRQGIFLVTLEGLHGQRVGYGNIKEKSIDECELSYMISQQAEGSGLGTFLVGELCHIALEAYHYSKAKAVTLTHNLVSRRILLKNQFERGDEYVADCEVYRKAL